MRVRTNIVSIGQAVFYWGIGFLSISLMLKVDPAISRIFVMLSMIMIASMIIVWRWLYAVWLMNSVYADQFKKRVITIGWNDTARKLYEKVYNDHRHPMNIVAVVTTAKGTFEQNPPREIAVEGTFQQLSDILATRRFDAVLLADFNINSSQVLKLQQLCMRELTEFMAIPSFYQVLLSRLEIDSVGGIPVMTGHNLPLNNPVNLMLKRGLDLFGGLVGVCLSAPIVLLFALQVYRESPGPVFFAQERVGRNGKAFKMYKIRSMKLDADKQDHLNQSTLREDPRILRIGGLMRKLNIDELPQFWNVVKGDMSLVGPRPERSYHVSKLKYDIANYNLRHAVKPGLTGWAAVNGWRGDTDLKTRIAFDIEYMEKWSIWFDIYIIFEDFRC